MPGSPTFPETKSCVLNCSPGKREALDTGQEGHPLAWRCHTQVAGPVGGAIAEGSV